MNRDVRADRTGTRGVQVGLSDQVSTGPSILIVWAIVVALAAQFFLAFRINVNWDEFGFLSRVYAYLRDELAGRLQTLHVHFFSWLPQVSANEIDQVVAGRLVMAALSVASAGLIYAVARRFVPRGAALFGLLLYLTVSVIVEHGASFRADPIATFLALLAMFLILKPAKHGSGTGPAGPSLAHFALVGPILAGAVMAVGMMVTVKSVFWLAVVPLLLWCIATDFRMFLRLAVAFALGFAPVLALLFFGHGAALAERAAGDAVDALAGSGSKMFLEDGIFPRREELMIVMLLNPLFWYMTIDGAIRAISTARRGGGRGAWLPLVLALPILTPFIYRNAYYYFYVFILPPAAILIGLSYEKHRQRLLGPGARAARRIVLFVLLAQFVLVATNYVRLMPDAVAPQRAVLDVVHRAFPEPVPYLDGFGVVASFPHRGFFMSSWGMDRYREAGRPAFRDLVAEVQPPLLLADSPALYAALLPDLEPLESLQLLPADAAFLRAHYVRYWSIVFVAGAEIELAAPGGRATFPIAVAGDYRFESVAAGTVDGRDLQPGDVIMLAAGEHVFEAGPAAEAATLRWATAQLPPDTMPVGLMDFFGFDE